jgi:hypothetical protein
MVPNITTILQRFTGEWAALLQPEAILTVCREIGYTGWRDRVLTPVTTVQLFLLQILHGNTACSHLPHLSGLRFSAAAYCQARARLPLPLFALLLERFGSAVQPSVLNEGRWHGHRTFTEQLECLFAQIQPPMDTALFLLMLRGGLRVSERHMGRVLVTAPRYCRGWRKNLPRKKPRRLQAATAFLQSTSPGLSWVTIPSSTSEA